MSGPGPSAILLSNLLKLPVGEIEDMFGLGPIQEEEDELGNGNGIAFEQIDQNTLSPDVILLAANKSLERIRRRLNEHEEIIKKRNKALTLLLESDKLQVIDKSRFAINLIKSILIELSYKGIIMLYNENSSFEIVKNRIINYLESLQDKIQELRGNNFLVDKSYFREFDKFEPNVSSYDIPEPRLFDDEEEISFDTVSEYLDNDLNKKILEIETHHPGIKINLDVIKNEIEGILRLAGFTGIYQYDCMRILLDNIYNNNNDLNAAEFSNNPMKIIEALENIKKEADMAETIIEKVNDFFSNGYPILFDYTDFQKKIMDTADLSGYDSEVDDEF